MTKMLLLSLPFTTPLLLLLCNALLLLLIDIIILLSILAIQLAFHRMLYQGCTADTRLCPWAPWAPWAPLAASKAIGMRHLCIDAAHLSHADRLRLMAAIDDLLLPWTVDLALRHELPPDLLSHVQRVGRRLWTRSQ